MAKAKNFSNGVIQLEGSYTEMACLSEALESYCNSNPNAIDLDIIKDFVRVLRNPELEK